MNPLPGEVGQLNELKHRYFRSAPCSAVISAAYNVTAAGPVSYPPQSPVPLLLPVVVVVSLAPRLPSPLASWLAPLPQKLRLMLQSAQTSKGWFVWEKSNTSSDLEGVTVTGEDMRFIVLYAVGADEIQKDWPLREGLVHNLLQRVFRTRHFNQRGVQSLALEYN